MKFCITLHVQQCRIETCTKVYLQNIVLKTDVLEDVTSKNKVEKYQKLKYSVLCHYGKTATRGTSFEQ